MKPLNCPVCGSRFTLKRTRLRKISGSCPRKGCSTQLFIRGADGVRQVDDEELPPEPAAAAESIPAPNPAAPAPASAPTRKETTSDAKSRKGPLDF